MSTRHCFTTFEIFVDGGQVNLAGLISAVWRSKGFLKTSEAGPECCVQSRLPRTRQYSVFPDLCPAPFLYAKSPVAFSLERFALFFGFLTIATGKLFLIPLAIFLLCYGMGIGNPCLNSLISKKSPSEERGLALGAAYSSQAAARVMGQPFAGLLALLMFKDAPYFASAIIIIFSIIVYFFIKNRAYKT